MKRKLACLLTCVLFIVALPLPVSTAEETTDIGCYEYGYTSIPPREQIIDDYNPSEYGETAQTIRYVSASGSDITGTGTADAPWATPAFAASQITAGDTIIRLDAGTWTITAPVALAAGVSLEGEGAGKTIFTSSTLTAQSAALVTLLSSANTDGHQHISGITFDGNQMTAAQAIEIQNRNFVAIHDCEILNFHWVGVGWRSTLWSTLSDRLPGPIADPISIPQSYVTGGRFYQNTVKNCAGYDSYARGALFCGGLKDFRIYDNTMLEENLCNDQGNITTVRGVPIKFWYYQGWMLGCKIYDNIIHKYHISDVESDATGWPFAIESIFHYGMEICGNDFIGAIDLNFGFTGDYQGYHGNKPANDTTTASYSYATYIHDNAIHGEDANDWQHRSIILEFDAERTVITRNHITDCSSALYCTPRPGSVISDLTFSYNQCTDIRMSGSSDADAVRIDGWAEGFTLSRFRISNNLFLCTNCESGVQAGGYGVILAQNGTYTATQIQIANNLFAGFRWNPMVIQRQTSISGLELTNNLFYQNNGWNGTNASSITGYVASPATVTNLRNEQNLALTNAEFAGLFVNLENRDYHLKENAVAINAGRSFGQELDCDGNLVPFSSGTSLYGDYNHDGAVNEADVQVLTRFLLGESVFITFIDWNNDNLLNVLDLTIFKQQFLRANA